jgi:hypothetical protein
VKKGYLDKIGDYISKKLTGWMTSKEEKERAIEEERKMKRCVIECRPHRGEQNILNNHHVRIVAKQGTTV